MKVEGACSANLELITERSVKDCSALLLPSLEDMSKCPPKQASLSNGCETLPNIIIAEGPKKPENASLRKDAALAHDDSQTRDPSLSEWLNHGGDSLARACTKMTKKGGLMVLGPHDVMRANAEQFKVPANCFVVFTHGSPSDVHITYANFGSNHVLQKEYSVSVLAEAIKLRAKKGEDVLLVGCETGANAKGGVAHRLAELLPDNRLFAPNGFVDLTNGELTIFKTKVSKAHGPVKGDGRFIWIKP